MVTMMIFTMMTMTIFKMMMRMSLMMMVVFIVMMILRMSLVIMIMMMTMTSFFREIFPTFQPCKGLYHSRTRRWLEVYLQFIDGEGFRKEYILLDTGSPKSIIIAELVDNLIVKRSYDNSPIIEIEGVSTVFELQPWSDVSVEGACERTRNINLLGTNFLNQFVIMDDFCSKTILVLKRASPLPTRV